MAGPDEQAAVVADFSGRPFQRRARSGSLQKAQAAGRAGFKGAADAATVAGLAFGWFVGRCPVEVDGFFLHVA